MPDKIMLITGTSRGIGEHLAKYYLQNDFAVIGCSRTPPEWQDSSGRYRHFCLDAGDEQSVRKMFAEIAKVYGRLDVLINNAGRASMNHALLTPMQAVKDIFSVNTFGTFLFSREAVKLMRRNHGYGRIINFSSNAVPLCLDGEAAYGASKAAIVHLTKILAKEFADFGVTVNAIGPTMVDTALIRGVPDKKLQALMRHQAIQRYTEYEDIENVVDFFISPRSGFVTGQVIYLGGL